MTAIPVWRPIAEYEDGDLVLLRSGQRQIFGLREGNGWAEMVDGQTIFKVGFEPSEFSTVPDKLVAEFAGG